MLLEKWVENFNFGITTFLLIPKSSVMIVD
nr:MAG TPA: Monopolin complex subunit CSM1, Dsn1p, kinetochore, CELL CYCLE.5A [Caudoviricetes sp.]